MIITIENTRIQKQTQIEVIDEFYTGEEDLLIRIGMEQFKLVSTKSEADKKREALAVEFGETYYGELYSKFPDFGDEKCLLTREACKDIIKAKLTGKFEELLNDANPELLLNGLVTAFGNYCQVKKKMDEKDTEIRNSRMNENVFFDYILRLEEVFRKGTTIKELTEGIAKCHEYASIDERQIFGYAIIFEQLKPFFNWSARVDAELREMKPYKPIAEQAIYTDVDYYNNHVALIAKEVRTNLLELKKKYDLWINTRIQDPDRETFKRYATMLKDWYVDVHTKFNNLITVSTPTDGKPVNVEELEAAKEIFQDGYKMFVRHMVDLRIELELEPKPFGCQEEKDFLLSHCGFVDFWYNKVTSQKDKDAGNNFMNQMIKHVPIIDKILAGVIDVKKLMGGKYQEDELKELVNSTES